MDLKSLKPIKQGGIEMKKTLTVLGLILAAAVNTSFALPISGAGAWGSFSGDFTYAGSTIELSLTNTSPVGNGGYLTGILFNVPSEFTITGFSALGGDFSLVGSSQNNGAPYGTFDTGAAVGGNWEGGGQSSNGIGVGAAGFFTFILSGTSPGLSTADFFGQDSPWFVARFRGFANEESDKVPAGGTPVPEPATMLLLGAGLAGMAAFGRRKLLN